MAQSTLTKSTPAVAKAKPKGKRPDIQGLRAIAVIAVIFDHLLHWPSGGFVGVDVFFVISGFVITASLLREHDKTGRISIPDFYRRRVRRILPASLVTLAGVAALSYLLFNASRAQQTYGDAIWSFFFAANLHFAAVGTDYFQNTGPVSPLQHFWSLAVEEQFYFVWPALMVLVLWLAGRGGTRGRKAVGFAMLAIIVVSFAWAMFESLTSPTVAYFSTFTRAWELGVGALLAVFATSFKYIPSVLRPILGWAGIAGILWSIFTITDKMPFPGPWAAPPVLATALVIAAGTGGEQRFMWPLTNSVAGYVGNISYSLYLWHFPIIIFLGTLLPEGSPLHVAGSAVLMLGAAALSYRYVEEPIRNSIWLDNSPAAQAIRRKRQHRGPQAPKLRTQLIALGVLATVTFIVVGYALFADRSTAPVAVPTPLAKPSAGAQALTPLQVRGTAVQAALAATEWPALTPDIGELDSKGRTGTACEVGPNDEVPAESDVLTTCAHGDPSATKTAFLLGDSYAAAYAPGIIDALEGYKVVVLTRNSCPAINIAVNLADGSAYPACSDFQQFTADQVAKNKPDLVLISGWHGQVVDRLASDATGAQAITEWKAALAKSVSGFAASAKQVAVLAGPPTGRNLQECATRFSKPADCVAPISGEYKTFAEAERSAVGSIGNPAVKYVPVLDWFCTAEKCPPFIGVNPVYVDGGHLTNAAAKALAPLLRQSLLG
jgi:peptidoglycan/LPS O-acetylase OafA/YrhL